MENYNDEDAARNYADLLEWQKDNNYPQDETTGNNVVPPRNPEEGGYGLDRENAYDSVRADRDRDDDDDDDDDNDDFDDDDDDDDDTNEDWGNVDPAGGPAPTSPGSAV